MNRMAIKIYEALKWASSFLQQHQAEERVAEILLLHYLNYTKTDLLLHMRDELPPDIEKKWKASLQQHVETGVPVQHLTGKEIFFNREFKVNGDVLIPRPETEEVVLHALEHFPANGTTCVDVGTGSGVIGITIALERPNLQVYATDISEQALQIAHENAENHGATINLMQGDFLQPLLDQKIKVDAIISNPPYIARKEEASLSRTVRDFDPHLALFADKDGLAAYETIVMQAKDILQPEGMIAFEIGYQQGEAVREIIRHHFPKSEVNVYQDINGKDRTVIALIE